MKWKPNQYAGCYTINLYCDVQCGAVNCGHSDIEEPMAEFIGETFAECAREARKAGWQIHRKTRTATCPRCVRLKKRATKIVDARS